MARIPNRTSETENLFPKLFTSCVDSGHPELEMTFAHKKLEGPLQSISLTALNVDGLQLVGLTLFPDQDEEGQPLYLGQASLGGVETDLRGRYPEQAGIRLEPRGQQEVSISAGPGPQFRQALAVLPSRVPGRGVFPVPSFLEASSGCHFAATRFAKSSCISLVAKPAPTTIAFPSPGVDVSSSWRTTTRTRSRGHTRASVAFRWEDADQESHLTLGYEEPLPPGSVVEKTGLPQPDRLLPDPISLGGVP